MQTMSSEPSQEDMASLLKALANVDVDRKKSSYNVQSHSSKAVSNSSYV